MNSNHQNTTIKTWQSYEMPEWETGNWSSIWKAKGMHAHRRNADVNFSSGYGKRYRRGYLTTVLRLYSLTTKPWTQKKVCCISTTLDYDPNLPLSKRFSALYTSFSYFVSFLNRQEALTTRHHILFRFIFPPPTVYMAHCRTNYIFAQLIKLYHKHSPNQLYFSEKILHVILQEWSESISSWIVK